MSASELARKYLDLIATGRFEALRQLFHADARIVLPLSMAKGAPIDVTTFCNMLQRAVELFEVAPRYIVTAETSQADRSVLEFEGQGTLRNGRTFTMTYCIVIVETGGLITELREYVDTGHAFALFSSGPDKVS
jgi:ketosteroid isomerase-like protein